MAKGKKKDGDGASVGHNAASDARLKSFIERVERLNDDKKNIADDIKEVFQEAADAGYDTAIIRSIIKARKMTDEQREERMHMLEVYMRGIGMLAGTPLGDAGAKSMAAAALH